MLVKNVLLGVGITNATKKEALEYIISFLQNPQKRGYIVTPNPEILVAAQKNKDFKTVLNNAEIALPDGVGVTLGGYVLGRPYKQRITGVEVVKNLCEKLSKEPITVGFLGGKPGVALKASECLRQEYPGLKVVLAEAGNPDENTAKMLQAFGGSPVGYKHYNDYKNYNSYKVREVPKTQKTPVLLDLNRSNTVSIDLLFVAFGHPKQEMWIAKHLETLPVTLCMAVGGSLDYISGTVPRAPGFVRAIGLEWLFRLVVQPWRIKRQVALLEFIGLIIKEKLSS
jgi:N-acetylglucosaminyldiphosphoundecaprenol N-acetyl-beta-D-mannosaminyltransferase